MLHQIHFHKKTTKVLYLGLLHSTLNNKKLETRVARLEEQLKKKKAMNKGWKIQIKKLETELMTVGEKLGDLQPAKKLLDEKERLFNI